MTFSKKKLFLRVAVVLLVSSPLFFINYFLNSRPAPLHIFTPNDVEKKLVDIALQGEKRPHSIPPFSLIDQMGVSFNKNFLKNKIFLVSFFFSKCAGLCPLMFENMKASSQHFKADSLVFFACHSITPESDSPSVLKAYAQKKDLPYPKWRLLTGDRKEIFKMARSGYFLAEVSSDSHLIHTQNWALVDPKGQIRGFYDGSSKKDLERIFTDIQILKRTFFKK